MKYALSVVHKLCKLNILIILIILTIIFSANSFTRDHHPYGYFSEFVNFFWIMRSRIGYFILIKK
jgi:hypothetical protein